MRIRKTNASKGPRWRTYIILLATLGRVADAGATPPGESAFDARWREFEARLAECTRRHGYDPASAGGLGPHELGAGERPWRTCVYAGIEEVLARDSDIPDLYQRLIEDDRRMTDAVEAGALTRTERRLRLDEQVRNLRLSEQINGDLALSREHERVRRDLERMRQLQEFERLVRPRIVVPLGR